MGQGDATASEARERDDSETFEVQQLKAMQRDDELNSLRTEMRQGFTRVDEEFKAVRSEMKEGFGRVDAQFGKVDAQLDKIDARFERIDERFDRLMLGLLGAALTVVVALIGATQL